MVGRVLARGVLPRLEPRRGSRLEGLTKTYGVSLLVSEATLDAAFDGPGARQKAAIRAIVEAARQVPVQLGGGLRDMAGVAAWLEAGIRRVILGSAAFGHVGAGGSSRGRRVAAGVGPNNTPVSGWTAQAVTIETPPDIT